MKYIECAPDEWKKYLPPDIGKKYKNGIYMFTAFTTDNNFENVVSKRPLYIGQSKHIRNRINQHEREGTISKAFDICLENSELLMIEFFLLDEDESDFRIEVEQQLISEYNPPLNKRREF